jgi:uncharacterized protein (TIGR02646 family)
MKKVDKDFTAVPEILKKDQLRCETALLADKKTNQSCWARVKTDLEKLYDFKCGYCEIDLRKFNTNSTVEHYRPKAKNQYYWLAHEWSNFLLACSDCQKIKDNNFPTENPQQLILPILENGRLDYEKCQANHPYLLGESPLILHPEIDNPMDYFDFNIDTGEIEIKNEDNRALKTCELLGLNRDNLCFQRKRIVDNLFYDIQRYYKILEGKVKDALTLALSICKDFIEEQANKTPEFSFVWRYLYENFDTIIEGN